MGPLINGGETLVTEDTEKPELLNAFFASIFTDKITPQGSLTLETRTNERQEEHFSLVEEDMVRERLDKLEIHKSVGPDRMHPWTAKRVGEHHSKAGNDHL